MKYIITQAYNEGEWFIKDFALIKVSDEFKNDVKDIKAFIDTAPEKFKNQIDVRVNRGLDLYFFDSSDLDTSYLELNADIETIIASMNDGAGFDTDCIEIQDISNLTQLLGALEVLWAEHAEVDNGGICFKAYNKYGDGEEIWTDTLDLETILNF